MTESEANRLFEKPSFFPVFCPKTAVLGHFSGIVSPIFPNFVSPQSILNQRSTKIQSNKPLTYIVIIFFPYELFTLVPSSSDGETTGGNASTSFRSASRLNNVINFPMNASISSRCSLHQNANKQFWPPRAVSV